MTSGESEVEVEFTETSSPIAKGPSDERNEEESSSFMHIEFAIGPERPPASLGRTSRGTGWRGWSRIRETRLARV